MQDNKFKRVMRDAIIFTCLEILNKLKNFQKDFNLYCTLVKLNNNQVVNPY